MRSLRGQKKVACGATFFGLRICALYGQAKGASRSETGRVVVQTKSDDVCAIRGGRRIWTGEVEERMGDSREPADGYGRSAPNLRADRSSSKSLHKERPCATPDPNYLASLINVSCAEYGGVARRQGEVWSSRFSRCRLKAGLQTNRLKPRNSKQITASAARA